MKKPKEGDLVRAILKYLRVEGILCWRNPSGMMFGEYKGKSWAVRMGTPGVPDIVALLPGGRPWFIECKLPGKSQNADQIWFAECCAVLGYFYSVETNLADVITAVETAKAQAGPAWRRCPEPPVRIKKPRRPKVTG